MYEAELNVKNEFQHTHNRRYLYTIPTRLHQKMRKQISGKTNKSTHTHTHTSIQKSFATKLFWFVCFRLRHFHPHCDVEGMTITAAMLSVKNGELKKHASNRSYTQCFGITAQFPRKSRLSTLRKWRVERKRKRK